MGGSSKKQTVGYKYFVGVQLLLCHGRIDGLTGIFVADRAAWKGHVQDGEIHIDKQNLFGGQGREGGVSGIVDVNSGHNQHTKNSYLVKKLGSLVPAYRRTATLVFRGWGRSFYFGNNPYIKDISLTYKRIHWQDAATPQWYDSTAEINSGDLDRNQAICFILDTSGSMSGGKLTALKTGMKQTVSKITSLMDLSVYRVDIMITTYNGRTQPQTITLPNVNTSNLHLLNEFIDSLSTAIGDNLSVVFNKAAAFFKNTKKLDMNRICLFLSDGEIEDVNVVGNEEIHNMIKRTGDFSAASGDDVDIFCINVDNNNFNQVSKIDNTPIDGIPVISGGSAIAIYNALIYSINAGGGDMNPAHMFRELVLSESLMNTSKISNKINEANFEAAADTLYTERFGLSYLWTSQSKIDEFKNNLEKTVDCVLYQNAKTNEYEIKLIRNDYDVDMLPVFDHSNIIKISEIKKNIVTEMVNSVTVNFTDRANDYKRGSVTVRDDALISMAGSENNTTVTYDMIHTRSLASRVAMRDLMSLSSDLANVTINVNLDGRALNRGDVIIIDRPDIGLNKAVMRVQSIDLGSPKDNQVTLSCVRDVFSLPDSVVIEAQPPIKPPIVIAEPSNYNVIMEAPYYELVMNFGQSMVDLLLGQNDLLGHVCSAACDIPSHIINTELVTSLSNEFDNPEPTFICNYSSIVNAIGKLDTILTVSTLPPEYQYTWIAVGDEIMTVIKVNNNEITVKRGCLDTIPLEHPENTKVYFCGGNLAIKSEEYSMGDDVNCRIITATSTDRLNVDDAPSKIVNITARAGRPYPPANVRFNNTYFPEIIVVNRVEIEWSSRSRKQQTSGEIFGWFDGDITPEFGVKYEVFISVNGLPIIEKTINETQVHIDLSSYGGGEMFIEIYSIVNETRSLYPFRHKILIDAGLVFVIDELQSVINKDNLNFIIN